MSSRMVEDDQTPMPLLQFKISRALHDRLRSKAHRERTTLAAIAREYIAQGLRGESKDPTKALKEIKALIKAKGAAS
jgi:hypothetical protein